ncbi:MAG: Fic family protein [Bacteroidota bacterium]|nr:Fic family protein [Bacteroidota bacterium]
MSIPLQVIPILLLDAHRAYFDPANQQFFNPEIQTAFQTQQLHIYLSFSALNSSSLVEPEYEADYSEDLFNAYLFSQSTRLSSTTLIESHAVLTKNMLPESQQGIFRKEQREIKNNGLTTYVAASPGLLFSEMLKYYVDLEQLLESQLTIEEVFYYASMLHLVLLLIQPFEDGNGRIARLIEKWFLAEKLGPLSWALLSEKYYSENKAAYLTNLKAIGSNYTNLDYNNSLPFLNMLPKSIYTKLDL